MRELIIVIAILLAGALIFWMVYEIAMYDACLDRIENPLAFMR